MKANELCWALGIQVFEVQEQYSGAKTGKFAWVELLDLCFTEMTRQATEHLQATFRLCTRLRAINFTCSSSLCTRWRPTYTYMQAG